MHATITIMPNGINAGFGGGNGSPKARGELKGWSAGSARRNKQFLQSVLTHELDGVGLALTLTVKDCPATHDEWERIRQVFVKFLKRKKLIRLHWVTEWQARGAPHFHMSTYFDAEYVAENPSITVDILMKWTDLTSHLGSLPRGQHIALIDGGSGWHEYVSKHASRGYGHYQREQGSIPKGWEKTGKLWGKTQGDSWPVADEKLILDKVSYQRLRRMVRSYLISQAREGVIQANRYNDAKQQSKARRKLSFARTMLKINKREMSEVRGINEWVPFEISSAFVDHIANNNPAFLRLKDDPASA